MRPARVEAGRSTKNAAVNKAILHSIPERNFGKIAYWDIGMKMDTAVNISFLTYLP
jgi:hypothetical protein